MLYYALIFLVIALIAGALAWVLFIIGIILLIVHFISGNRRVVP